MSHSIVFQLVKKDFLIWRKMILIFSLISLSTSGILYLLYGRIPNVIYYNLGLTLLIFSHYTCGIVLLMQTNVFEKAKSTQIFIMSLPVSVKEFTLAKLLVNIPVFSAFWVVMSTVIFYFCFVLGLFPMGTLPFITMILLGIFIAYICILSVSILCQSLGVTILSIMLFEMSTSAYLWGIAYLEPIHKHVFDSVIVWNSTAVTIVIAQVIVAISVILMTLHIQSKKQDFV